MRIKRPTAIGKKHNAKGSEKMPRKPKRVDYLAMEEVLNTYWIERSQMQILLPQLSNKFLRIEFEKILAEMDANNEPYFNSKPILIPVDKVVKKYKINTSYIFKEAKRMRREREYETKAIS